MTPTITNSWLNLAGRTAIVTGAASGIGKVVSQSLYLQGCNVVQADAKKTTDLDYPIQINCSKVVACDITNESQVKELITIADDIACSHANKNREFPSIPVASILVNCAGITKDAFLSRMEIGKAI